MLETWTMTVIVEADDNDFRDMREWLEEHAGPVPIRNADVLAKFVSATLNSNAQWDGVHCRFAIERAVALVPQVPSPTCHDVSPAVPSNI
jgi:hypothetical protein